MLAGIVFMNESPRWLVEKNRHHDAARALATVRGKSIDDAEVIEELDEIIADFTGREKMPMIAQLKASVSGKKMHGWRCQPGRPSTSSKVHAQARNNVANVW